MEECSTASTPYPTLINYWQRAPAVPDDALRQLDGALMVHVEPWRETPASGVRGRVLGTVRRPPA